MWESLNTGGRIGLVAGIVGGLAGIVVAYVSVLAGPGEGSRLGGFLVVTLMVLVFVGSIFFVLKKVFGPIGKQRKLQKSGLPAEATILELKETNITVNNVYPLVKLKLEVRPPGGQPYQAEVQTVIGRLNVPQYQPGAVVSVRYDPSDPSNVALADASEKGGADPMTTLAAAMSAVSAAPGGMPPAPAAPGGLAPSAGISPELAQKLGKVAGMTPEQAQQLVRNAAAAAGAGAGAVVAGLSSPPAGQAQQLEEFLRKNDEENEEIRRTGTPAPAVIVQATPLNVFVNGNNPAMTFILDVQPEGKPNFSAQVTGVIGEASVPKYQPGKIIYVKYDPADQSRVSLDHS